MSTENYGVNTTTLTPADLVIAAAEAIVAAAWGDLS